MEQLESINTQLKEELSVEGEDKSPQGGRLAELVQLLTEETERGNGLQSMLKQVEQSNRVLEDSRRMLNLEVDQLALEKTTLQTVVQDLRTRNYDLQSELEETKLLMTENSSELSYLQSSKDKLQVQLDTLSQEQTNLQQQISSLMNTLQTEKSSSEELRSELIQSQAMIVALTTERDEAQSRFEYIRKSTPHTDLDIPQHYISADYSMAIEEKQEEMKVDGDDADKQLHAQSEERVGKVDGLKQLQVSFEMISYIIISIKMEIILYAYS